MLAIPEKKIFTELLDLARKNLLVATMFLTGHGSFKTRLKLFNLIEDDTCRFCKSQAETAEHILCDCPIFAINASMEISFWKN